MRSWDDLETYAMEEATRDLEAGREMAQPILAAWRGEEPCCIAFVRDFAKGAYHEAIMELLALTTALGADRLGFAVTARAWSLDDPIAPVADGVDLRQRVLMLEIADASRGEPEHRSVLIPFDQDADGGRIRWGERMDMPCGEGWIASVLTAAVTLEARARMLSADHVIAGQAERLLRLGHVLAWPTDVAERLGPFLDASGVRR